MKWRKATAMSLAGVMAASVMSVGGVSTVFAADGVKYADIKLGEDTDTKADIKFITNRTDMLDSDYSGKNWDAYLKEFNDMYPDIKVEIEGVTDYAQDSLLRLQGGDWGDIMMIPEVDKSDLSTYFLSYGDVDSVKEEVKYPNRWLYENEVYGIPITVDGKQYSPADEDYCFGINANSDETNQKAAMIFVKWMTEKSGYSYNEGGLPIAVGDDELPEVYQQFTDNNVEFISNEPAIKGEEDVLNELNADSELMVGAGGNEKIQGIVEHAANGDESFDDIMNEWNEKWSDAQDTDGVEVNK